MKSGRGKGLRCKLSHKIIESGCRRSNLEIELESGILEALIMERLYLLVVM